MSLDYDHLMPRGSNMSVNGERKREELEGMLDVIYTESSPSVNNKNSKSQLSKDYSVSGIDNFAGRYVTKVVSVFPLEVSKRFVWPHITHDGIYRPSGQLILRKLFNIDITDNALLVITPTATASRCVDKYIVHCYTVDTQWHLGASNLVNNETALLKQSLGPGTLSVIFCSSYIELEDAYMPTAIKGQLFKMLELQSKVPMLTWYKGRCISLHLWSSESQDNNMDPDTLSEPSQGETKLSSRNAVQREPGGSTSQRRSPAATVHFGKVNRSVADVDAAVAANGKTVPHKKPRALPCSLPASNVDQGSRSGKKEPKTAEMPPKKEPKNSREQATPSTNKVAPSAAALLQSRVRERRRFI